MHATALVTNPAPAGAGLFHAAASSRVGPHLLGLEGVGARELVEILDSAARWREVIRAGGASQALRGVAVCLAFFEDSTRTRVSFELAAQRLGAMPVTLQPQGSSMSKGESLADTLRTVAAMHVDLVVVRHRSAGVPEHLARFIDAGIVNAGDGSHEHPTQGLLDLLTLRDAWGGRFEGRRIVIAGDLAHSRVARSAIFGLVTLGARVLVAGPPTLVPAGIEDLGVELVESLDEAMAGADAAMALRIQRERMEQGLIGSTREYARRWGLDATRVARMKPDAVVLHPGPFNRDVEIASEVVDGPRSRIWNQVENGAAVRCAVLERCAAARREIDAGGGTGPGRAAAVALDAMTAWKHAGARA
jgi:aspartate carbamoyltransferase catalytic subunit